MDVREKLVELIDDALQREEGTARIVGKRYVNTIADHLISHGATVQEWISASKTPKENGYYLCVILFSAVGNKKEYKRKILFWEDNVWIEKPNSFRVEKPLYWTTMLEIPKPPKGE